MKLKVANIYNECVKQIFHPFMWSPHNNKRRSSRVFSKRGLLKNVSQHSQENTCVGDSLIDIVAGLQLQPIFIKKEAPALMFFLKLYKIFNKNFFLTLNKFEKNHCYQKHGSGIYRKSNTQLFISSYGISKKDYGISGSANGLYKVLSVWKITNSSKWYTAIGLWRSLTFKTVKWFVDHTSEINISQVSAHWYSWQTWLIVNYCSQKKFLFSSFSDSSTSISSDISIALRKSHKTTFVGVFEELQILAKDFFEMSHRRHTYFWDFLRRFKGATGKKTFFWDVFETF